MAQRGYSSSAETRYIPIGRSPGCKAVAEMTERILAQFIGRMQRRFFPEGRKFYAKEQQRLRYPDLRILSKQAVMRRISNLASNDALSFLLKKHVDNMSCQRRHIFDVQGAPRKLITPKELSQ